MTIRDVYLATANLKWDTTIKVRCQGKTIFTGCYDLMPVDVRNYEVGFMKFYACEDEIIGVLFVV